MTSAVVINVEITDEVIRVLGDITDDFVRAWAAMSMEEFVMAL